MYISLTDSSNEQTVVRSSNGDGFAIDLGQKLNRQCILDVLHGEGLANVRRSISNQHLDHRPVVVRVALVLVVGNVLAEPCAVGAVVIGVVAGRKIRKRCETTDAAGTRGSLLFILIVVVTINENDAGENNHGEGNSAGNPEHHDD